MYMFKELRSKGRNIVPHLSGSCIVGVILHIIVHGQILGFSTTNAVGKGEIEESGGRSK
jgi:hypothetical protein